MSTLPKPDTLRPDVGAKRPPGRARDAHPDAETVQPQIDVEAAGPLQLVVAGAAVSVHDLPVDGRLTLGRGTDADIRIAEGSVSRLHIALSIQASAAGPLIRVEDLGSSNGTSIAGEPIDARLPTPVALGESISIGDATAFVRRTRPFRAPVRSVAHPIVGQATQKLFQLVERFAATDLSVLLLGETGSGKEVIASEIHRRSPRHGKSLLTLNCAAFTETLLESELFGHKRGAFSGAADDKVGLLAAADGGTVFLDEVGELSQPLQSKLLRVLEERRIRALGAVETKAIDVRFISATNRDLEQECRDGRFRSDLYYRLNGVTLQIPPLRDRSDEIEPLAALFAQGMAARLGEAVPVLLADAVQALRRYEWPGNIRQLKNMIERAVVLSDAGQIAAEHLDLPVAPASPRESSSSAADVASELKAVEKRSVLEALEAAAGSQRGAAKILGWSRGKFIARLDEFGIQRPKKTRS